MMQNLCYAQNPQRVLVFRQLRTNNVFHKYLLNVIDIAHRAVLQGFDHKAGIKW